MIILKVIGAFISTLMMVGGIVVILHRLVGHDDVKRIDVILTMIGVTLVLIFRYLVF